MNAPLGSQALPRGGAEAYFQSPCKLIRVTVTGTYKDVVKTQ